MAETLVSLFAATLNPDLNQRKAAEEELGRAKLQPQCVLTVLQILTQEGVDLAVRQSAAVFFKNLVKGHWAPEDETAYAVPAETKTQVKDGLLSLFLYVPPRLQAQLSEAMSLIASHDFPNAWPKLLDLEWKPTLMRLQLWRPFTAFLFLGKLDLYYGFTLQFVWM